MHIGTAVRTPAGTTEISVLVSGVPQPLYRHPSGGRPFVAGQPGRFYTLRVRNLTAARIEVINSVDGRNTLKDEPGDIAANQGLVFPAHATGEFTGWRVNREETREFIFGEPSRSVAAQATGSEANTGVIGFAVYRERSYAYATTYNAAAPVVAAATFDCDWGDEPVVRGSSLGTGIGERREDRVAPTSFTRAMSEPDVLVVGYETEHILHERGLTGPAEPDAFPGVGTGYERYPSSK
jgi:hypothetical protein